jgi:hypothetical protein
MPEMPREIRDARAAIRLKKFDAIIDRFEAIINRIDKINLAILKHDGNKNRKYDDSNEKYHHKID